MGCLFPSQHRRARFSTRFHPGGGKLVSKSDDNRDGASRKQPPYHLLHPRKFPQPPRIQTELPAYTTKTNTARSTIMKNFIKGLRSKRSSKGNEREEEGRPKTSSSPRLKTSSSQRSITPSATVLFPLSIYRDGPLTASEQAAVDGAAELMPTRKLLFRGSFTLRLTIE